MLHFSPHSKAKLMIKALISGMESSGISDVVFASVYSDKTRLKKNLVTIILLL